jgi:HD-like signal output (HDOD) protein
MNSWASRLFASFRRSAATPPAVVAAARPLCLPMPKAHANVAVMPKSPAEPALPRAISLELEFVAWLMNGRANTEAQLSHHEHQALTQLDVLIADTAAHKRLLPRTAAVVPQLLARLRDPATTLATLEAQISRDVTLVAEVVRMANGSLHARREVVVELAHAIRLLGTEGLRVAIARTVLQPLINVRGSDFLGRCTQRLWSHADKKAQLCAAMAKAQGLAPFDGYLLGLVHDAAWSAVLRELDGLLAARALVLGANFVAALTLRRDRLFAIIAAQWQLSDDCLTAAAAIAKVGLRQALCTPAHMLAQGDDLASLLCVDPNGAMKPNSQHMTDACSAQVQALVVALREAGGAAVPLPLH